MFISRKDRNPSPKATNPAIAARVKSVVPAATKNAMSDDTLYIVPLQ